MKKHIAVLCLIALSSGCANQQSAPPSNSTATNAQLGACATNFASEGSFFSGTRLTTFEEFPKKTLPGAFDSLLQAIAASGYQIVSSSKEAGLISANQTVSYGQGKTAPLNFVIKKIVPSGVRVDISFSMSGGVSTSTEGAQREFCKLLAAVAQSPNEVAAPTSAATPINKPTTDSTKTKGTKKKVATPQ